MSQPSARTSKKVAEGAAGVEVIIDLHGKQAQGAAVDAGLGLAHGLQRVVGLARIGGPHVIDHLALQRAGHRIPQLRLAQIQALDRLAAGQRGFLSNILGDTLPNGRIPVEHWYK